VTTGFLLKRIAQEHRRVLLPLLIALLANLLVYGLIVYPMAQRVANIEESSRAAATDLAAATREFQDATGLLTGKDRASQELTTFYSTVLPRDLPGARRLTTLRLPQLARQSELALDTITADDEGSQALGTLKPLKITMDLIGTYADMREFIHRLEVAPEFVIVDNVSLSEGADDDGTLAVSLELSTYYRDAAP
jgi:Tfp pilus assembly protein PilO